MLLTSIDTLVSRKYRLHLHYACYVAKLFGFALFGYELDAYGVVLYARSSRALSVIQMLRYHYNSRATQLADLVCIDFPATFYRFKLVYVVLAPLYNVRFQIVQLTNETRSVASVVNIFCGAAWLEREVWDLFGVLFIGHPDLRRILTDYGFLGYPLRKDFPLSGFREVFFNDLVQLVVYQRITFSQEMRDFSRGANPWLRYPLFCNGTQ